jgi:hypothetical protein
MELNMWAPMIKNMREELTRVGFAELKTADEVESTLPSAKGTTVVFVNSVCGCAGGIARPAAGMAIASGVAVAALYIGLRYVTPVGRRLMHQTATRPQQFRAGFPTADEAILLGPKDHKEEE